MIRKIIYLFYQPYKWLFFFPFIILNTLFFGLMGVIIATLISPKAASRWAGAIWARCNAFFTPMFVSVSGKENIKKNTSYIIIPNHQSYYDIFLIYGWLEMDIKWVMKKELRKIPALGIASEKMGHIFLDRSNNKEALESLNKAKQKLVNGTSIVIFPEGSRSATGQLNPFKRGAFKLAFDLGLPILPVTLIGTKNILPSDSVNLLPGKVKMIIHEPVDIKKYSENEVRKLMSDVSDIISKPLKENL